ncbi:hypothetical protein ANS017_18940 [Paraclostridium bifermentans]|uniref:hypothetical protein n=1 Tax=Paraclostridium bifermentans TaxID=1490 RepID=UPI0021C46AB3|nr:hypothetical protein [Paraclostridium bifermentans]GKZ10510.1 hypothetical protein ANS017_18940 [Paraclostridium bifermentans]
MNKLSDEILNSLSPKLREKIINVQYEDLNIEEIRLRVEKPLIINSNNRDYFYNNSMNKLDIKKFKFVCCKKKKI